MPHRPEALIFPSFKERFKMDDQLEILKKRLCELARRSSSGCFYTFTDFLTCAEQGLANSLVSQLDSPFELWGGIDGCERRIACFGSRREFGYDPVYPIVCLKISPKNARFAHPLSHRDYLGSLMALGIKRETIGDIYPKDKDGYIFCQDSISGWICENLTSVGTVSVVCQVCDTPPPNLHGEVKRRTVNVASARLDALICAVWKLSRTEASRLVAAEKVSVDGLPVHDGSKTIKEDSSVSARGYGKFIFREISGTSKKGRLFAEIDMLV
ncbi:MAG: hypothetical protein J6L81_02950 [Clostridia bacterium]|nr:hypothetical protein [Clostridia bacterium]